MLKANFFGTPQLWVDGVSITHRLQEKEMALLVYLMVTEHPHHWSTVTKLLWERPIAKSVIGSTCEAHISHRYIANMRNAHLFNRIKLKRLLWQLPSSIQHYLQYNQRYISLNQQVPHWCDVRVFSKLITRQETIGYPTLQQQIMALYQGEFLTEFIVEDAPLFNQWSQQQRRALEQQRISLISPNLNSSTN